MRLVALLATLSLLVGLGLAGGASSAHTNSVALPPNTYTTGGFTETQTDLTGRVLFTRSGDLAAIPQPTPAVTNSPAPQACCSATGCDSIDIHRDLRSWPTQSLIDRFHSTRHWCWQYPTHTASDGHCYWSDPFYVDNDPNCTAYGYWYTWRGSTMGGRYVFRQGKATQCVVWVCNRWNPWIEVWTNGNGAWASNQGD